MGLSNKKSLFIKVVQNNFTIFEEDFSLEKNRKIALSSNKKKSVYIPFYPFKKNIEFLRIKKNQVFISPEKNFRGLVVTENIIIDLEKSHEKEFILNPKGFASLLHRDLLILLKIEDKIEDRKKTAPGIQTESFFSLFFPSAREKKFLLISFAIALLIFSGFYESFFKKRTLSKDTPLLVEEIEEKYILPLINKNHLQTIPEALQTQLNRKKYVKSTILLYKQILFVYMGWDYSQTNFIFPNSVRFFLKQNKNEEYDFQKKLEEHDKNIKKTISSSEKKSRVLAIPMAHGQSLAHKLHELLQLIDTMQESFDISLQKRKELVKNFTKDPPYNWSKYKNLEKNAKSMEALSAIHVFSDRDNEAMIYEKAKNLSDKGFRQSAPIEKKHPSNAFRKHSIIISNGYVSSSKPF